MILIWLEASNRPHCEKPVFAVSDQVRHKLDCAETDDGQRVEISNIGCREIILFMLPKQWR